MSPDPAPSIDAKVDVASALWLLPPRQRAVLVLRFYTGLSLQETSTMLGISLSAVKTHSQRGLARLRATGYLTTGSDHDGR
jgi:RNA polymerase sigma factor (sigma-70 family)